MGGEVIEITPEHRSQVPSWNPPLVLDRVPLPTNSFIRDFDNGRSGYVANDVEQVLLLRRDMAMPLNLKKHEIFLSLKRDLALATQAAYVAEEWVD
nr:hypothetical protein CFP56_43491 [Quercus suber]